MAINVMGTADCQAILLYFPSLPVFLFCIMTISHFFSLSFLLPTFLSQLMTLPHNHLRKYKWLRTSIFSTYTSHYQATPVAYHQEQQHQDVNPLRDLQVLESLRKIWLTQALKGQCFTHLEKRARSVSIVCIGPPWQQVLPDSWHRVIVFTHPSCATGKGPCSFLTGNRWSSRAGQVSYDIHSLSRIKKYRWRPE